MSGLARKVLICAAVDGLLLQPIVPEKGHGAGSIKIEYGNPQNNKIGPVLKFDDDEHHAKLDTHGIIGLLNLVSTSYLISITRREQVAQVRGHPIFTIKDVALIPLSSKADAENAINAARKSLDISTAVAHAGITLDISEGSDLGEEGIELSSFGDNDHKSQAGPEQEATALEPSKNALQKSTTYLKNAGGFANRWFNRKDAARVPGDHDREAQGLEAEQQQHVPQTPVDHETQPAETVVTSNDKSRGNPADNKDSPSDKLEIKANSAIESLTPRILRSARFYFSTSGFYFSYEEDLSTSLARTAAAAPSMPLWKRFDPLYFWNRHLLSPLIAAGQDPFILPILQGFVGQRSFSVAHLKPNRSQKASNDDASAEVVEVADVDGPTQMETSPTTQQPTDFFLTLISRRSIRRAGLRYLRRGVDNEGNVANNVETEQILSPRTWESSDKVFSLLQIRGSIPLFFSQSPYSFKPLPEMFGSEATNAVAFGKHFALLDERYGPIHAVSLIDKHATEAGIGKAYEKQAETLNAQQEEGKSKIGFEWFDFHGVCKGMNYKNVSILLDTLHESLTTFGWTTQQDDQLTKKQNGVFRVNCMDCLDRTNVVQSAIGGWTLEQQLSELGLAIDLQTDVKTQWFNTLWADNGDAISKQYAGTSALKGDFTRTRKRNWTGALSDFSLTLTRYYNNIFGDYFLQTCIDYYLGYGDSKIFDEFETDMMARDHSVDMQQVRQNAIDTCLKMVLEDSKEDFLCGWTVSSPQQANTLRTLPFEECVLLLTTSAVVFCRLDWSTEKVRSVERADLLDVCEIWHGTYITSTLGQTHLDPRTNVGLVLRFNAAEPGVIRTNTRSLQNEIAPEAEQEPGTEVPAQESATAQTKPLATGDAKTRLWAFKVLPPKDTATKDKTQDVRNLTEVEITESVCGSIAKAVAAARRDESPLPVEKRDIISVAEAKKNTGYVESLGYSLKKLVWS